MRNQLSLTVRTKLSLLVTVLLQTVLFFAITTQGFNQTIIQASTGDSVTTDGLYTVVQFTQVQNTNWIVPAGVQEVEYLVVAGGGGGGNGYDTGAGGGGAGGMVLSGVISVSPGSTYTVNVGAGGSGGADIRSNSNGSNGSNSQFSNIIALGGDAGNASRTVQIAEGRGGVVQNSNISSATGGDGGGNGSSTSRGSGGGGGGAGGAGGNGSLSSGGSAGIGLLSNITGSNVIYGAGGAGARGNTTFDGQAGANNTGQGGGGGGASSSASGSGGNGGTGIVVLRYRITNFRIDAADSSTYSGIYDLNGGLAISTQSGNSFFEFDGSNDYIDTNLNYTNLSSFTISTWMRYDDDTTGPRAILSDEPTDGSSWEHRLLLIDKNVTLDIKNSPDTITPYYSLPSGWNNIVTSLTDGRIKVYINGKLVSDTEHKGSPTQSQEIWIGASALNGGSYYYKGDISIVEYYSRGLTADEINTKFFEDAERHFQPYLSYASGIIRIDESKVDADLTNFPVTVVLNSGNFDFDLLQSSGADVFFTDTNHNLLPFEVDFVDVANERAVYHVLYSGVINNSDTDQDILIRYGSGAGYFYDFSHGYRPTEVWSNGYEFVSHLGTNLIDSTGQRTLINSGTSVSTTSGSLGESRRFNLSEVDAIEISGLLDLGSNHTILGRFQREDIASESQGSLNVYIKSGIPSDAWTATGVYSQNYPYDSGVFSTLRSIGGTAQTAVIDFPATYFNSGFSVAYGSSQSNFNPPSVLSFDDDTINTLLSDNSLNTITTNHYAVEVTGWFVPSETGYYRFDVDGDDSVELIINNQLISHFYGGKGFHTVGDEKVRADGVTPAYLEKVIGSGFFEKGIAYPIVVRAQEWEGGGGLRLVWQRPSESFSNNWYIHPEELYSKELTRMDVVSSHKDSGYALNITELGYPYYAARVGSTWPTIFSSVATSSGTFDTFTATNNPSTQSRIYTSGLVSSGSGLTPVTPTHNTVIGQDANQFHTNGNLWAFNGFIDEIRLSSVERTAEWVKAEYYSIEGQLASPIYTVSFVTNSGTSISSVVGEAGDTYSTPSTSRDGFRFMGWYSDAALTTSTTISNEIPINGITYYAKWVPDYERYDSGIIRIDKTKVEGNLTNFPLTIVLNSGNFEFSLIQSSGADVFFTDTNHNLLPFEVDYVNVASGIAVYHVLYSGTILNDSSNQDILIRYGDVENYFYDFSAGYNPTEVWDENYVLVMHMGSVIYDATQTNTFLVNGTQTIQNNDILGEARYFDGNDFINFSGLVSSEMSTPTTLVRFDWNTSDLTPSWDFVIEGSTVGDLMIALQNNLIVYSTDQQALPSSDSNPLSLGGVLDSSMFTMSLQNSSNIPDGLVIIDDNIYSGLNLQSGYNGGTFNPPNSSMYSIGRRIADNSSYFTGVIDEIRLSKIERTSGWILAEHYALSGQLASPVYTVSFVTNSGSSISDITGYAGSGINPVSTRFGFKFDGWYLDSGLTQSVTLSSIPNENTTYYAKWNEDVKTGLIVDANNIDENLTDFPVTVVLNSQNFDFTGMVASGLYFSDGTNYLDFEVDFIDVANQRAVFHVLLTSISSSTNTTFYIHQGRELDFTSGRNATNVWKSSYVFVSHMGTTVTDSKTPGRSITVGSNSTTTNSTLGKARVFDNDLNDSISIGDITLNSDHTILVVLKPHTLPARQDFLSSHSGNGGYGFFFSNSNVAYSVGTGGGFVDVYTTPLTANTSYVTTGTVGANGQRTFLNGTLTNTSVNQSVQDLSLIHI